jgi:hypothetical protein
MRNHCFGLIFLISLCGFSCNGQQSNKFVWKTFEFKDAGVAISLPCEPERTAKVFQEKPKVARSYSFSCSEADFDFAVSLPERFNAFNPEKAEEELQNAERTLRVMIDDKAAISGRDMNIQGKLAREFTVKNDWTTGRQVAVVDERGIYNIQLSFTAPNGATLTVKQISEFHAVANKYFDSIKIVK